MLIGAASGLFHGVCYVFMLIVFGLSLEEFARFEFCSDNQDTNLTSIIGCTDINMERDELIDRINHPIIFYYCLIGVISLASGWLQVTMFQLAAERQITKIRTLFFRAILKQEISWFDLNPTGEVNSRLNE